MIGGGRVAERKVFSLLKAGADVTVVSPTLTRRLCTAAEQGMIRHICRSYRCQDTRKAFLVIAATDSPDVNSRVAQYSPSLLNVVDVPSECNFIAPAVVRKGPLLIAVSTSGASPAFSRAIREELEALYGPEFSGYLKFVKEIRAKALSGIGEKDKREQFLKSLATGEILQTLRTKGLPAARKYVMGRLKKLLLST